MDVIARQGAVLSFSCGHPDGAELGSNGPLQANTATGRTAAASHGIRSRQSLVVTPRIGTVQHLDPEQKLGIGPALSDVRQLRSHVKSLGIKPACRLAAGE